MYSYNKLSWQQSELFHLLKKLGESITPSQSKNISTFLCSWAGCGATWVTALHLWYNHAHCTEHPLCISEGWTPVCAFGNQTFWKDSGGHSRWEEMSVLLLGSLWDVARIWNHCHFIIYRHVCIVSGAQLLSGIQLFAILWTVACQAPLSMGFSRQNTEVDCYFHLQGIFLTQGLNPHLLHWQVDSLPLSHQGNPGI